MGHQGHVAGIHVTSSVCRHAPDMCYQQHAATMLLGGVPGTLLVGFFPTIGTTNKRERGILGRLDCHPIGGVVALIGGKKRMKS